MTKFYIDSEGNYLGGFEGCEPDGGIEIDTPPSHGWQKYDLDNSVWLPLTQDQLDEINALTPA